MRSADEQRLDDEVLSRFLLGSLPAEEAERLEELTTTDDEFALRLDAVENDLVDAFARGDLSGDKLEQFEKSYLSSPRRREKVEFARTLLRFGEKTSNAVAGATTRQAIPDARPAERTSQSRSPRSWFRIPRLDLQWGFAVAAMALLVAGGYLFVENQRLRQQVAQSRNQQIALNQRTQDLESQLREQRTANSGLQTELEGLRESAAIVGHGATLAVLLVPETRGINPTKAVHIQRGTNHLTLRLRLESDDFPAYRVTLKDPAKDRSIWKSSEVKAQTEGSNKTVSINIPTGKLKGQNYVLELIGIPVRGAPESVSSYTFRAMPD